MLSSFRVSPIAFGFIERICRIVLSLFVDLDAWRPARHRWRAPRYRVDLARSSIGVAVRTGAPRSGALLAAKSIAYSDCASGVYVSTELFKRLDIVDQVAGKSRMIPAEPVVRWSPAAKPSSAFNR